MTEPASTIANNANITGGGLANFGTAVVSNSTFSGNTADPTGGAIYNGAGGVLTVSNSTFSDNFGVVAGAIYNGGLLALSHSTITNNRTGFFGGALYNDGTLSTRNTIVAANHNFYSFHPDLTGDLGSLGHNLIGDTSEGSGFDPTDLLDIDDPRLGPLQDNGGPTMTHALLPGSPALDAGDNAGAPDFDQRGLARIVGGTIDIGAFEVQIGAATRLVLSAPAAVTSGVPFDVTVTALDAYGRIAARYAGTVTFTATDPDSGVVLPAAYTFTADDQGTHTFAGSFTLVTEGDQTLTATDPDNAFNIDFTLRVDPGL